MILALNEWVFHDLLEENGADKFRETYGFLTAFWESADRLVIPPEQRWTDKAFRLMRRSDPRGRQVGKLFLGILLDTERSIRVRVEEAPEIEQERLSRIPAEDIYLVLAYIAAAADYLVTTDQPLFDALVEDDEVNCRMREEFLPWYSTAGN